MAGANLTVGVNNSQFRSAMSEMNGQLKGLQGEFNLASAKAKLYGSDLDQLKVKKEGLTKKIELGNEQIRLTKERMSGAGAEMGTLKTKQSELATKVEEANKKYKESVELTGKNSEESKKLKGELDQVKEQYNRNEKAIQGKSKELDNLNNKLNNSEAALLENKKALEDVAKEINNMPYEKIAAGFNNAGDKMMSAGAKATLITAPIAGAGVAAFNMATSFEDSMAKVMTIADETVMSQDELKSAIMDLSDQTGISANEIAENVYNAISAGQSTGEAVNFVSNSTKLAKAGFAEAGQSLDVLTTILNAYELESTEAARVSDVLVQTQNKGKTTVGELSANMGKLIPTAKGVNVGIEQLGAGYAIMTSKGIATAESTTYMNSMLNELGKSGTKSSNLLKESTGKTFQELMASGESLSDVLVIMQNEAEKNGLSLSDMFGSAEAGKAALTLVSDGGQAFNSVLNDMEKSAGSTDAAFDKVSNTTNQSMKEGMNAAKNALTDLGTEMLVGATPIIKDMTEGIKGASEWFRTLDGDTKQNILQIGALVVAIGPGLTILGALSKGIGTAVDGYKTLRDGIGLAKDLFGKLDIQMIASKGATIAQTVATNAMSVAQGALNVVMSMNPLGIVLIAVTALTAGIVLLWNNCEGFREGCIKVWEGIKNAFKSGIDSIKKFLDFEWNLPKLKMPHFKASGEFSLMPLKVPTFKIDWYHTGAIFNKRTILPGGIGVGDAFKGTGNNPEAIIPLDSMYRNITSIIRNELDRRGNNVPAELKIIIENFYNNTSQDIEELMREIEYYRKKISY